MRPLIVLLILCGCASSQDPSFSNKISSRLMSELTSVDDTVHHSVIVTLTDSIGLPSVFPSLRFANNNVALGHCTKQEIYLLCKNSKIVSVDVPKKLFPK